MAMSDKVSKSCYHEILTVTGKSKTRIHSKLAFFKLDSDLIALRKIIKNKEK